MVELTGLLSHAPSGLWIVMPCYNEEACIKQVVDELAGSLNLLRPLPSLLLVDDGSTDSTAFILSRLSAVYPFVKVLKKTHDGYSSSLIQGMNYALLRGASWIMQMDADGQCDPKDLPNILAASEQGPFILGLREKRINAWTRTLISWIFVRITSLIMGRSIPDPNVPYRLIRADLLQKVLKEISPRSGLLNTELAYLLAEQSMPVRIPISFRARQGSQSLRHLLTLMFETTTFFANSLARRGQKRIAALKLGAL